MTGLRTLLYDVEWQTLRVSCLTDYSSYGGWSTEEGTNYNLTKLEEYTKHVALLSKADHGARIYRAINLLNATRMGYSGQGKQGSVMDLAVQRARNEFQAIDYAANARRAAMYWRWERVESDLMALEQYWFEVIENNLQGRKKKNDRARGAENTTRQELGIFLDLMHVVAERRGM